MDLGSLFIILAIIVLVGLFVGRPFFESKASLPEVSRSDEEHEFSALMAERDRVLNSIQELDFDAALGKIPLGDYPSQRESLLLEGATVLRQLDNYQSKSMSDLQKSADLGDPLDRIEVAVEARKIVGTTLTSSEVSVGAESGDHPLSPELNNGSQVDDEMEALIANRRRERQGKASGFCPQCGGTLQKKDLFCPKCGARTV